MNFKFLIILLLTASLASAQNKLPIIKASSINVTIKDGDVISKDSWTLSPQAKPDVYICDRTRETKWFVFKTDIDSIKLKIKPGSIYNFVVLLNGKDSCYTQVKSAVSSNTKSNKQTCDTIAFELTKDNAIHVKSIINNRDTVSLHFDLSSFDFRLTRDAILKKTKLLSNQKEVLAGSVKPNFNNLEKVFSIKLGNVVFANPDFSSTGFTAHEMDGKFGWNIFENKILEIDYDKSILIVRSKMPAKMKDFTKAKLQFTHSLPYIQSTFIINNKKYIGNFILDNGSDQAVILDSIWAQEQNFPQNLPLIKTSSVKDPRGVVYKNKIVLAPTINLSGFKLTNIPSTLLVSSNPIDKNINFFGNDLLKRFNIVVDFSTDFIYFKPNSLLNKAYIN